MASEVNVELKLLSSYSRLAFLLLFLGNYCLKRWQPQMDALAEKVVKAGMRYKTGGKWKKVF